MEEQTKKEENIEKQIIEEKKEENNIEINKEEEVTKEDKNKNIVEKENKQKLEEEKKAEDNKKEYKDEENKDNVELKENKEEHKIEERKEIKEKTELKETKEETKIEENKELKETKEEVKIEENKEIKEKTKFIENKEDIKIEESKEIQKLENNNIEVKDNIKNIENQENKNSIDEQEEEKLDEEDKKEEEDKNEEEKKKENEEIEKKIEEEKLREKKEKEEKERKEKEEKERKEKEEIYKNSFEFSFWNKYEAIHQRYKTKMECYENTIEIFSKILNSLRDHQKVLNTIISKNYLLFPGNESTQGNAMNMIKKGFEVEFNQLKSSIELLKRVFIDLFKQYKDKAKNVEKDAYNNFIKIINKYKDSKSLLEKNKNKYHQSITVAELSLRNSKTLKIKNFDNSNESKSTIQKLENNAKDLLNEAKKNYDKYLNCIKETNKSREESIEKQKNFWKIIQSLEEKDGEFIVNLLKSYFNRLQDENETKKKFLEEMDTAINDIDLKKDKISLINLYKSNEKPDEVIELIQYEPQIDFENASNPEEFRINHEIIKSMKTAIPDLLPNFNIEKETQKQEMIELSKKIFVTNKPFTEEEKNKLFEFLKEKWSQNYFLIYLSKQRTKGRFCRSQKLVKELAEILNIILKTAEQEKDYHAAKNCMILSQTYYFEEKENKTGNIKKNYLINYIINHKWLRSPDFWRGIIQEMIDSEAKNYMKLNPDEPSIFDKNNKKSQAKISNICFSQLLPYANNMKEFYMDMRMILKIIDEFVEKYNIKKEIADTIYKGLISDKLEEIEKMRKEYKENPNFENELMSVEEVKKQREGK